MQKSEERKPSTLGSSFLVGLNLFLPLFVFWALVDRGWFSLNGIFSAPIPIPVWLLFEVIAFTVACLRIWKGPKIQPALLAVSAFHALIALGFLGFLWMIFSNWQ